MAITHEHSRYALSPKETKKLDTAALRENFLIKKLFEEGKIHLVYSHYDRMITGGIQPAADALQLEPIDALKAPYFLERRELGVINIGGAGKVQVDGISYDIGFKEAIYIGKGSQEVLFSSRSANDPAKFYLNSTPAHHTYPTKKVTKADAQIVTLGSLETANHRTINKLLVAGVVDTCQLQMGMTELKSGSVWNTMPAHTHDRRMEVYLYFEVPEGQVVSHFMGQPEETRHLFVHNEQAVISPPWSIHAGAGTSNYTFIWGMAGENMDYGDMDGVPITGLK
ncbi:4-deoxy-L-threo-5-hexosulose-uronate ketol-isomerase [bacterium A37T11]|nr:4-deoxy-L-threo-5-hexosulose-uronate ketol-isomerase [bacterium A37T11]